MHPAPMEFAPRRGWNTLFLMGALLFVGTGLWLLLRRVSDAPTRKIGLVNVLFFGACALAFLREAFRSAVRLRLDAAGLEYRHPQAGAAFRFAWSALAAVGVRHEERAFLVVLTLRDPAEPTRDDVPDWARARGASPTATVKEATISPVALGTTAESLAAEIERFWRYYGVVRTETKAQR